MAVFPLFIDLNGKKCMVAGGGRVAAGKIRVLAGFGAAIYAVSPDFCREITELAEKKELSLCRRRYSEEDLEGAFLAVAATSDRTVNNRIAEDAKKKNIFVNVADDPEKCSFIFPAVVKKEGLVVGISTSGAFPALSKHLRIKIEGMLENVDGSLMEELRKCRKSALEEITDEQAKKAVLGRIAEDILSGFEKPGNKGGTDF